MLDNASRAVILSVSIISVAAALAVAPVRARGSVDSGSTTHATAAGDTTAAAPSDILIARDPFSGEPADRATVAARVIAPAAGTPGVTVAPLARLPRTDIGPLPNNLAEDAIPAIPADASPSGSPARVTAIATGAHPYALLEIGGDHQIKGLGDRVSGKPIVAIDIDGVTLAGGQRLTVAPGETTP